MDFPELDPCRPDGFSTGMSPRVYVESLCFYRRGSVRAPPSQSHTAHGAAAVLKAQDAPLPRAEHLPTLEADGVRRARPP